MQYNCAMCNVISERSQAELERSKTGRCFCSRSCAAKYNNKLTPKRKLQGVCASCNQKCPVSRKYCSGCWQKHLGKLETLTLKEVKYDTAQQPSNQWTRVRDAARHKARRVFPAMVCAICGYDKIAEVCHIQPISSFSEETLVAVVNAIENLVLLCPNHHWEFDHGQVIL